MKFDTAPKGWNSWDCYGASVKEEEVFENAKILKEELLEQGWDTVVVDIQWYEPTASSSQYNKFADLEMDKFGRLMPATNRFPSASGGKGFKNLSKQIHDMGLKFGIHIMRGIPRQAVHKNLPIMNSKYTAREVAQPNSICPWNTDMYGLDPSHPGSQEYYNSIFKMYAEWGVDYVKVDDIAASRLYGSFMEELEMIRKAIDKSGREMVLSLSPGPASLDDVEKLQKNANLWRMTDDFWDIWELLYGMFDKCRVWAPYVKNGSYPDCDMLPMGRIGIRSVDGGASDRYTRFTHSEQRTMMTLWSIFGSPLMFGGDLRFNDEFTWALLKDHNLNIMHREVQTRKEVYNDGKVIVWRGDSEKDTYIAIFNVSNYCIGIRGNQLELISEDLVIEPHDVALYKNEKRILLYGQ